MDQGGKNAALQTPSLTASHGLFPADLDSQENASNGLEVIDVIRKMD